MINISLNKLKQIAKSGSIKDYKNKSKQYLTKNTTRIKTKNNPFLKKVEEIKKDFSELRHGFSKSKINEFIRSLYNTKIL